MRLSCSEFLVARSAGGQIETVKYQILDSMLLNEVQRQQEGSRLRIDGAHQSQNSGQGCQDNKVDRVSGRSALREANFNQTFVGAPLIASALDSVGLPSAKVVIQDSG